ncbi:16S rRNA (uracil(1498)-N(3))-methyltransferase [Bifidobacterium asteroides]|uniref:Ribosomal RNA small subunit methyltransferase E n=1 Tax=Bifidobacterium asteroides TaxID=1684 RepID=A0A318M8V8_9BIFI|nr:16S rRNA (uracil(1498)-N(3))-methyltransferase [Bifidobacterium asteroides]PXY82873.1 16S rRNA (uracil(1498)-N(3))-methyltransferase [Bifidobacterium asteroides]
MTAPLFLLDPDHDDSPLASDELHTGWRLTLPEHIRRHALGSMRLQNGDQLDLSDGNGLRISALVRDASTGLVEVIAVGRQALPEKGLVLVQALAKGGRDEQAIDMATQIGVDQVMPWQADRSIAKWRTGRNDRHWQATLDAATEQSRRAYRPRLLGKVDSHGLAAWCRMATNQGNLVLVLHQDADLGWDAVRKRVGELPDGSSVAVVVGPEGGIANQEVQAMMRQGALPVRLGGNILRAALAGPVALTLLADMMGRWHSEAPEPSA